MNKKKAKKNVKTVDRRARVVSFEYKERLHDDNDKDLERFVGWLAR